MVWSREFSRDQMWPASHDAATASDVSFQKFFNKVHDRDDRAVWRARTIVALNFVKDGQKKVPT
jgi:hypothetical protein